MNLGLLVALENADKVYLGFLTLDHMGTPLKIKISKIGLRPSCFKLAKIKPRAKNFLTLALLVASENANKVLSDIQRIFNTGPYGDPL